jgi:serine/threonine protein kinase
MLIESTFSDLFGEISHMCNIKHKNLIKLHGVVLSSAKQPNLIMVTELAPFGSLLHHVQKHPQKLLVNSMHSYFQQISCGLEYLESKKMIHRDLAARNILLFSMDTVSGEQGQQRIGMDLGCCAFDR